MGHTVVSGESDLSALGLKWLVLFLLRTNFIKLSRNNLWEVFFFWYCISYSYFIISPSFIASWIFLPLVAQSVQFSCSVVSDSLRSHGLQHARLPCPSSTPGVYSNSCPIESVMPSNHLILCRPLLLLPSIFLSISVFSNESVLHIRWSKCWSFSFSISPSSEHSGLISFRMDWLDLLAVQGTLKSLLQHHRSKASILQHSAFLIVQISHPYMTTGKTIALTRKTLLCWQSNVSAF